MSDINEIRKRNMLRECHDEIAFCQKFLKSDAGESSKTDAQFRIRHAEEIIKQIESENIPSKNNNKKD